MTRPLAGKVAVVTGASRGIGAAIAAATWSGGSPSKTYLRHPYHWGHVDRWFDGEAPRLIVRPGFCHTFCLLDDSKTSVGNPASASAPKWST